MERMERDDPVRLTVDDIAGGLKHAFTSVSDPHPVSERLGEGDRAAVEWMWECEHTGLFQGLKPKGRRLMIRGVTIVDQNGKDGPTFSRYVDWSSVMEQLGMYASYRPTIETDGEAEKGLDPPKVEPTKAKPSKAEPTKAKPTKAKATKAKPTKARATRKTAPKKAGAKRAAGTKTAAKKAVARKTVAKKARARKAVAKKAAAKNALARKAAPRRTAAKRSARRKR